MRFILWCTVYVSWLYHAIISIIACPELSSTNILHASCYAGHSFLRSGVWEWSWIAFWGSPVWVTIEFHIHGAGKPSRCRSGKWPSAEANARWACRAGLEKVRSPVSKILSKWQYVAATISRVGRSGHDCGGDFGFYREVSRSSLRCFFWRAAAWRYVFMCSCKYHMHTSRIHIVFISFLTTL